MYQGFPRGHLHPGQALSPAAALAYGALAVLAYTAAGAAVGAAWSGGQDFGAALLVRVPPAPPLYGIPVGATAGLACGLFAAGVGRLPARTIRGLCIATAAVAGAGGLLAAALGAVYAALGVAMPELGGIVPLIPILYAADVVRYAFVSETAREDAPLRMRIARGAALGLLAGGLAGAAASAVLQRADPVVASASSGWIAFAAMLAGAEAGRRWSMRAAGPASSAVEGGAAERETGKAADAGDRG